MIIKYEKKALKFLAKADKRMALAIKSAIDGLVMSPQKGDIKQLEGYKEVRYRLRVGKYRVIFRYENDGAIEILAILDIGSRGDIYKEG